MAKILTAMSRKLRTSIPDPSWIAKSAKACRTHLTVLRMDGRSDSEVSPAGNNLFPSTLTCHVSDRFCWTYRAQLPSRA